MKRSGVTLTEASCRPKAGRRPDHGARPSYHAPLIIWVSGCLTVCPLGVNGEILAWVWVESPRNGGVGASVVGIVEVSHLFWWSGSRRGENETVVSAG